MAERVGIVALPGSLVAAGSDGVTVWCAAGDRLLAFEADGATRASLSAPAGLRTLAAAGETLAATLDPGVVAWLDPRSGRVRRSAPVGGEPFVVAGGGAVWTVDPSTSRAWRLGEDDQLVGPVPVPGVDRVAPDGQRIWWTSRHDTLLRQGERSVDVGAGAGERGGLVVCAGSVWLSVTEGLVRVGAWGADRGPAVPAPAGPVPFLVCAGGTIVGSAGPQGLFVLDPSVDADARRLDVHLDADLQLLVGTRAGVWAFPARRPEAHLVNLRPGA